MGWVWGVGGLVVGWEWGGWGWEGTVGLGLGVTAVDGRVGGGLGRAP